MIAFLLIIYLVILGLLLKLKVVKPTLWLKLSPLVWFCILLLVLWFPLQFSAPGGPAVVFQYSVAIVPNVTGEVIEVTVEEDQQVKEGDVLLRIDPVPYQAAVDGLEAQLKLAKLRLQQSRALAEQEAGSRYEVESYESQVKQLEAELRGARYNLRETVVRAPADGFVTGVALRAGARVANLPLTKAMSFIDTSERFVVAQIHQNQLRLVEPGQSAQVTFKFYPGKVFEAEVFRVVEALPIGQAEPTGIAQAPRQLVPYPYYVGLRLKEDVDLPVGAIGTAGIYTDNFKAVHLIRRVMMHMDAWKNYVVPN